MSMKVLGPKPYFWQWDIGQKLVIDNQDCGEVHFHNGTSESALIVAIRTADDGARVVDVPNILLQTAESIRAYLYQRHENEAVTLTMYTFQVMARIKPADYVYTETEVLNYSYLDKRLNDLEGEGLANAVEAYLKENPVQAGATEEEAKQIAQNKTDIEKLYAEKLDATELPTAINTALAQAKASGEFDGADGKDGVDGKDGQDGYTPQKNVDYFDGKDGKDGTSATHSWNGTVLTVTSASGTSSADLKGENGRTPVKGTDYFTEADKQEMVSAVLASLPVYQGEVVSV